MPSASLRMPSRAGASRFMSIARGFRIRLGKEGHAGGIAMEKIAAADRPDLALREKSCDRDWSQPFRHCLRVMIHSSEQALSAPAATEDQRAEGSVAMGGPVGREQEVQIFARRLRVTQMKLDGLPFLDHVPDRDGAGCVIGADEIAD